MVIPHSHSLLEIDDALVTESNPPSLNSRLDAARCARLHNYLTAYGWMVQNQRSEEDLGELLRRPSYFEQYGDGAAAAAIRNRLDPALAEFLHSIIVPEYWDPPFFIWVNSLVGPSELFLSEDYFLSDQNGVEEGEDHFVLLYHTVSEMGGHCVGLIYDQVRHRVAFPFVQEYLDSVSPVDEHLDMWHPLETMLSNWIHMIRIGKVTAAIPDNSENLFTIGIWMWQSYGAVQVETAVAAFDRLTAAIEARMPPSSLLSINRDEPLLTDTDLDNASVPHSCFIRSFLAQVKTPRFTTIAPGLEIPHDASAFAARQKFTVMPPRNPDDGSRHISPVLIFAATESSRTVNFDSDSRYIRFNPFKQDVQHGDHSTPAGLYSESVHRGDIDIAEEGFRLLLPFRLSGSGARKSDGVLVERQSVADLFQHGFLPFGGEHRAQRLERLLDRWSELVEEGVWRVGSHGVEGSIDRFRDADGVAWRDYWIPPDW